VIPVEQWAGWDVWYAGPSRPWIKFEGQGHRTEFRVTASQDSFLGYGCTVHVCFRNGHYPVTHFDCLLRQAVSANLMDATTSSEVLDAGCCRCSECVCVWLWWSYPAGTTPSSPCSLLLPSTNTSNSKGRRRHVMLLIFSLTQEIVLQFLLSALGVQLSNFKPNA